MQLPRHQTDRFYRIWFELLHYVNEQQRLVPNFPDSPKEGSIMPDDALQLRNPLWADDALRESFIATNLAGLSPADLAVIVSWRYRLAGNFFLVRHLKKYSVFLSEQPNHAYGVLGLVSPIDETIGPVVPIYVQAVLLPFEGQIIYDSLLASYPISFGPGIRSRLNDTYRNAQESEGIITTLEPADTPLSPNEVRKNILARNVRILNAFRKDLLKRNLSYITAEQHVGNIEAFAQNFLLAHEPPRGLLDLTVEDVQVYLRAAVNKTTPTSFKRFVRFLDETGRMDYEQVEPLRDFLKQVRE
jgi:hypothetical protein